MSLLAVPGTARLYAGTLHGSIYRSDDYGRNWSFLARLSPNQSVAVVELDRDPHAPATLYALGSSTPLRLQQGLPIVGTFFRSDDEGMAWKSLADATAIAIDPQRTGTVYRGIGVGPIFKSTDRGENWTQASPLFSSTKSVIVDQANPDFVYAFWATALDRTSDGGATWSRVASTLPFDFRLQIAGREGPGTLFAVSGGGVYRSQDGGQTWTIFPVANASTVYQLVGSPDAGEKLFAATDRGVFRSDDLGQTWSGGDAFFGYPVRAVAASEPNVAFAGVFQGGAGFFRSEDAGSHWSVSDNGLLDAAVVAMAPDPRKPARIYAAGPGVFRSEDYGVTWQTLSLQLRPDRLAVDPTQPDRVYAVISGIVWRSTDAGATWAQTPGSPQQVATFVVDAAGSLYAGGTEGVFRSTDGGDHWALVNPGQMPLITFLAAADPLTPGVVYALSTALSGFSNSVFKTVDGGTSWRGPILTTNLLEFVTQIAAGVTFPHTLYAVRSFHERQISIGSVDASLDGGDTWFSIFSAEDIRAIAADPVRPSTLYVSTPPNGLYPSTPIGVYAVVSPGRAAIIGQRGFAAQQLAVSSDASTLYAISAAQELWTLPLNRLAFAPRTIPSR